MLTDNSMDLRRVYKFYNSSSYVFLYTLRPWTNLEMRYSPILINKLQQQCLSQSGYCHLVCIICGSAASWMMEKVLNTKGGLHNRTTGRIRLEPFTLAETVEYLRSRKIKLSLWQITQLYMTIGGIPHYLQNVQAGKSATQINYSLLGIINIAT